MRLEPRRVCLRCHKAETECICGSVSRVANRTRVVILQHPRETFHAFGTVRFAKLGLENVRVVVAEDLGFEPDPERALGCPLPSGIALLYPSPIARRLEDLTPAERPSALLVLDGTWSQSRGLYRRNPWLHSLPHVQLTPKQPGQYRIRREPNERSLSTIEAIVSALEILEPDTPRVGGLLEAFGGMIDRQIRHAAIGTGRVRRKRTRDPANPVPEPLRSSPERVVLAYAEGYAPGPGEARELVYWSALRLDSGEAFSAFVRPSTFSATTPSDVHLELMRLPRDAIAGGCSRSELKARWREFFRDGDVLAAWNQSTLDFLDDDSRGAQPILLKAVYCNFRKLRAGALEEVVDREALAPMPVPFVGRAGQRMSQLWPVARMLSARARELSAISPAIPAPRP